MTTKSRQAFRDRRIRTSISEEYLIEGAHSDSPREDLEDAIEKIENTYACVVELHDDPKSVLTGQRYGLHDDYALVAIPKLSADPDEIRRGLNSVYDIIRNKNK